jgi:single-stranded DNA-binding protein
MSYTYLVGRVGTKPEIRKPTASSLAEFRLAVDGQYDASTRSRPTTWYDVTVWEPMHEVAATLRPGMRVWVAGPTSVFKGESGDRNKIKASEFGMADKFLPGPIEEPDEEF